MSARDLLTAVAAALAASLACWIVTGVACLGLSQRQRLRGRAGAGGLADPALLSVGCQQDENVR